jgi:hypothetical protein
MDGKSLITALAFLTIFATVWATILVAVLPGWSKRISRWIFGVTSALVVFTFIWVIVSFIRTPPAAVQQTLQQAMINLTDNAIFKGKNWNIHGAPPSGLLNAGGNTQSSIEGLTTMEIPEYMLVVPPTGTSQSMTTTRDSLRHSAENVANRLLYRFDPNGPEWPMLQSDAKEIFAEVMHRLPPIKTKDVYIEYRTGYERVCGLNSHLAGIDKYDARNAAFYLMILVEQLPPDTK